MISLNKLVIIGRKKKKKGGVLAALAGSPQRKGICAKIYTTSPKKPNSAVRKVTKVRLSSGYSIIAGIPGIGFKIIQYSNVLVRGGRLPDVPGVRYKLVRGVYDFKDWEVYGRKNRRSKFGRPLDVTYDQYNTAKNQSNSRIPYKKTSKIKKL